MTTALAAPRAAAMPCAAEDLPPAIETAAKLFPEGPQRWIIQRLITFWNLHGYKPVRTTFMRNWLKSDLGEAKAKQAEGPGRDLIVNQKYLCCPDGRLDQLCPTVKLISALLAAAES